MLALPPLRRTGGLGTAAALCGGLHGAGAAAGLARQRAERFTMPAHGGDNLKNKLLIWHCSGMLWYFFPAVEVG